MSLTVLSLGAGVQSSALLIAAAEGLLPKPDLAIFADTGWEPKAVYTHLDRLIAEWADPAGIPVEKVSAGNIYTDTMDDDYMASLPFYLVNDKGGHGMNRRICTSRYKMAPVMRRIRLELGAKESNRECRRCDGSGARIVPWSAAIGNPREGVCSPCRGTGVANRVGPVPRDAEPVDNWIGFSTDEIQRVADSRIPYVRHVYPLLDLRWSRQTCIDYLLSRGVQAEKSACIGCPFHDDAEWQRIKETNPDGWDEAVTFDAAVRRRRDTLRAERYLHSQRVPLDEVVLRPRAKHHQTDIYEGIAANELQSCSPFGCRTDAGTDYVEELALVAADEDRWDDE